MLSNFHKLNTDGLPFTTFAPPFCLGGNRQAYDQNAECQISCKEGISKDVSNLEMHSTIAPLARQREDICIKGLAEVKTEQDTTKRRLLSFGWFGRGSDAKSIRNPKIFPIDNPMDQHSNV